MHFAYFQYLAITLCGVLNAGICLYVLFHNPERTINRFFALFCGGVACWNLGMPLLFLYNSSFFISLILEGGVMISAGLFFFGKLFPDRKISRVDYFLYLPISALAILVPTGMFISSATITQAGYIVPHNEPLFFVYGLVTASYMIAGVVFLIKQYLRSSGFLRLQLRSFLFGLVLFCAVSIICDVILPSFSIFELNLLGPIVSLFFVATTAYSIVRYQLMDIRFVIQRSIIYIVFLTLIIGLYALSIFFFGYLLQEITDVTAIGIAGVTMVLGIFCWEPVKRYLQKITDPIFFKDRYNYATVLHQLSRVLQTTLNQQDIFSACTEVLQKVFKTDDISFSVQPADLDTIDQSTRAVRGSKLVFPIVFENRTIAVLRLGQKRSGDVYTREDIQLLSTFAAQSAVAIEKSRLFQKVEEYSAGLEQLVEERTEALQKLQQDQKQAMIDISHNLQTPLAIIRSQLELLEEHAPESDKIHVVQKSLDRVSAFIRQLLHLAKLDHHAYNIPLTKINLSSLLREQIDYFEVMAAEADVEIIATIARAVMVRGNKVLLGELMTNLVANAIACKRANVHSKVTISLTTTKQQAIIHVRDNGVGIAEKELPELFTRFYRTSSAESRRGTGLGLAISKRIVDRHNGSIAVKSVLGDHTVFTISLPLFEE